MRASFLTLIATAALLLAGASPARPARKVDVPGRIKVVDKTAASRMLPVAKKADGAGLGATARRILRRVVALDPGNSKARRMLGFERVKGVWVRTPEERGRVNMREDSDPDSARRYREDWFAAEDRRANAILRVTKEAEQPELCRPILLELLAHSPRHEEVHRALGHERIGGSYVRPELAAAARRRLELEPRWRGLAVREPATFSKGGNATLAGVPGGIPTFEVDGHRIGVRVPGDRQEWMARFTAAPRALLGSILGKEAVRWDPSTVYFLDPRTMRGHIYAVHPDEEDRKKRLGSASYRRSEYTVIRTRTPEAGVDVYAHNIGYRSMQRLASPKIPGGENKRDYGTYSWLKEGFGYFMTLELLDTAETYFFSATESSGKVRYSVPPPDEETRENCLAFVRAHLRDGSALGLNEVFGRTLNNLDLLASLESWTFLRFLAFLDPAGMKRLPGALLTKETGSMPIRAKHAIEEAFGVGLEELEPMWRAFTLEVE